MLNSRLREARPVMSSPSKYRGCLNAKGNKDSSMVVYRGWPRGRFLAGLHLYYV